MQSSNPDTLEARIQQVLDDYRPTLYIDGGDVDLQHVDDDGIAHVKMLGACIDCPISLLTMKLGIQRLLKENFDEITGINAITDIDISALYNRSSPQMAALQLSTPTSTLSGQKSDEEE
jgi:Fe-S cluster biogenesis protein NfuA